MHSGKKGKTSSTKPDSKKVPKWVRYKPAEVEKLVVKMGGKGMQSTSIGRELRDVYGIPDVKIITKKKISKILKDSNNSNANQGKSITVRLAIVKTPLVATARTASVNQNNFLLNTAQRARKKNVW